MDYNNYIRQIAIDDQQTLKVGHADIATLSTRTSSNGTLRFSIEKETSQVELNGVIELMFPAFGSRIDIFVSNERPVNFCVSEPEHSDVSVCYTATSTTVQNYEINTAFIDTPVVTRLQVSGVVLKESETECADKVARNYGIHYGDELPVCGNEGRIFFLKVTDSN